MVGYSEILQTLGAMIIFSLILLTANRYIQANTLREVESEAEKLAVALAQNIIEEAQTKPFDANTIAGIPDEVPEGFSGIGPGTCGNNRACFDDFDDYDGYTEDISTGLTETGTESFHLSVAVSYVSPPDFSMASGSKLVPGMFKKMVVTVTSDYLNDNNQNVQMSYVRRYYKTKD